LPLGLVCITQTSLMAESSDAVCPSVFHESFQISLPVSRPAILCVIQTSLMAVSQPTT